MKKIISSLMAVAITFAAFAQKVEVKKDMLLVDGVPIAKVEKTKGSYGIHDITLRSIETDKEFLFAHWNSIPTVMAANGTQGYGSWWEITFMASKEKVEIEVTSFMSHEKEFLKMLVKNRLIKGGAIDAEAYESFYTKYGGKRLYEQYRNPAPVIVQQPATTVIVQQQQQQPQSGINIGLGGASINIGGNRQAATTTTTSVVVAQAGNGTSMAQRDRSQGVTFQGNQIVQGGVLIGTFSFDTSLPAGSPTERVIVLYPDGNKAGEGVVYDKYSNAGREGFTLLSGSNGSSRQMALRPGEMVAFQKAVVAAMVREGML
jgi:hypothetical protein